MTRAFSSLAWASVCVALGLGAGTVSAQGRHVERSVETMTRVVNGVRSVTTVTTTRTTENGRTETHVETETRTENGAPPAPPAPPPPPSMQAPPGPAAPPPPGLASEALEAHNRARATVEGSALPPLQWDAGLAARASDWARTLCGGGRGFTELRHRPPEANGPGENLAMQGSSEPDAYPVSGAMAQWMGERRYYNRADNRCEGGECGHYTQVVWRNTTRVGCGTARCPMNGGGMTASVWVCNYNPPGNWRGQRPY